MSSDKKPTSRETEAKELGLVRFRDLPLGKLRAICAFLKKPKGFENWELFEYKPHYLNNDLLPENERWEWYWEKVDAWELGNSLNELNKALMKLSDYRIRRCVK